VVYASCFLSPSMMVQERSPKKKKKKKKKVDLCIKWGIRIVFPFIFALLRERSASSSKWYDEEFNESLVHLRERIEEMRSYIVLPSRSHMSFILYVNYKKYDNYNNLCIYTTLNILFYL